jgi:SAM-dependent methyltransferase
MLSKSLPASNLGNQRLNLDTPPLAQRRFYTFAHKCSDGCKVLPSMPNDPSPSIRGHYVELGVDGFYAAEGDKYRNPHEDCARFALAKATARWSPDLSRVLDLACGSGEMTLELRDLGASEIVGVDPYTGRAYRERIGQDALAFSFEQIAAGALRDERFSLIVCSYALHLLEPSRLPGLLAALGEISGALVILSPHKRPQLDPAWGWQLVDEIYPQRVRTRFYRWEQSTVSCSPRPASWRGAGGEGLK